MADDCIEWTQGKTTAGYGELWHGGRPWYAHRVAWAFANGRWPEGGVIHHTCHNPGCINPAHLVLCSSQAEHVQVDHKGRHYPKAQARMACKRGHPYTEATTYYPPKSGDRICRVCRAENKRRAYAEGRRKDRKPPLARR